MSMKRSFVLSLCLLTFGNAMSQNFQKTDFGVKTNVQSMDVEIQFYGAKTVRVLKTPEKSTLKKKSLSVVDTKNGAGSGQSVKFTKTVSYNGKENKVKL